MNTRLAKEFAYSAVLATYQPSSLLQLAVKSILEQTIKPYEIILVDDCSQEIELDLLRKLVPDNIKLIFHKNSHNLGAGFSRNIGVNLATRDYVIFFDDDDVSLPNRSVIHRDAFVDGASVSYVSSKKYYPGGYQVDFRNVEIHPSLINPKELAQKLLYGRSLGGTIGDIPSSTLAIVKKVFLGVGGFDQSMRRLEDADLALRLSLANTYFSWSSSVAVERTSTFRQDKGGSIEANHERIILHRYGNLLGWWRRNYSKALIDLREFYFGGIPSRGKLIFLLNLLNPFCALVLLTRIPRFVSRLNHDRHQSQR